MKIIDNDNLIYLNVYYIVYDCGTTVVRRSIPKTVSANEMN